MVLRGLPGEAVGQVGLVGQVGQCRPRLTGLFGDDACLRLAAKG